MSSEIRININPHVIFLLLFLVSASFLALDLTIYFYDVIEYRKIQKLFDITREGNIPTWFASTQALLIAFCAFILGFYHRTNKETKAFIIWLLIGLFFFIIAVDDAARIHERIGSLFGHSMRQIEDNSQLAEKALNFPSYFWQLVFVPFLGLCSLMMFFFFIREMKGFDLLLVFCLGIGCYVIAVCLDYIDGLSHPYASLVGNSSLDEDDFKHLSRAIEEFIEMFGTTLILTAFIMQIGRLGKGVQNFTLHFKGKY